MTAPRLLTASALALLLAACGGGGGEPGTEPEPPPPAWEAQWTEPELLASVPQLPAPVVGTVRANPGGGLSFDWGQSMTVPGDRSGFAVTSPGGTTTLSDLPSPAHLLDWTWDASGPLAVLQAGTNGATGRLEFVNWRRTAAGGWSAQPIASGGYDSLGAVSSDVRSDGYGVVKARLNHDSTGTVYTTGLVHATPGSGWGPLIDIGFAEESQGGSSVAVGLAGEALLAAPIGWRRYTPATGWSPLQSWPFDTAGAWIEAHANAAGEFLLHVARCPDPNGTAPCRESTRPFDPATGVAGAPTDLPEGVRTAGLRFGPQGHAVAWWWEPGSLATPHAPRHALWASVRDAAGAWSAPRQLAPERILWTRSADFVVEASGRITGAWGLDWEGVEAAVHTPEQGWSSVKRLAGHNDFAAVEDVRVVLDEQAGPTVVWGEQRSATAGGFYRARLR